MPVPFPLGDPSFVVDHGVRFAYVAGAMGKGIASEAWVIRLARAGILSFFGAGGLHPSRIASAIDQIQASIGPNDPFGINFLHNQLVPSQEDVLTDLLLARDVRRIEASAFIRVTPALVRYRLTGLRDGPDGAPHPLNRVMAKVSRPEVARQFLAPPDPTIVAAPRPGAARSSRPSREGASAWSGDGGRAGGANRGSQGAGANHANHGTG